MKVVLASNNAGKLKEFQELFETSNIEITPQAEFGVDDADETGTTFIENAIIKARHACEITGKPAIADDSGLEVDALNGAPGVYSARFAGIKGDYHACNEKLLSEMQDVPKDKRQARFHCVLVFMRHKDDPTPLIAHGIWEGEILEDLQGAGGFGYDPLFFDPKLNSSAAELAKDQKNKISHRGQAMRQLEALLSEVSTC